MLLQNVTVLAAEPITRTGGTLAGESVFLGMRDQTALAFYSNSSVLNKESSPRGYLPGNAWFPAIKAGGAAARADVNLSGTAAAAGGRNASADAAITLTPSSAALHLLVDASATANLSLSTTSAPVLATVFAVGSAALSLVKDTAEVISAINVSGSGSIALGATSANASIIIQGSASASISLTSGTATATAIAQAVADSVIQLTATSAHVIRLINALGTGSITLTAGAAAPGAVAHGVAHGSIALTGAAFQGSIVWARASSGGPEPLSPEGLALAVWRSVAADNNDSGTMGEKLNSASSAGDPWGTLVPGAYAAGTAGNLMGKLLTVAKFLGLK